MEYIYLDEQGNVIDTPDWEIRDIVSAEEIDDKMIYHCRKFTEEELEERKRERFIFLQQTQALEAIKSIITTARLPDNEAVLYYSLYPKWSIGESYKTGDIRLYDNELYRALQDSVGASEFHPDTSTALWKHIEKPNEHGIFPWVQPLGATDAYNKGDKVTHNGKTWISNVDNNIWEPGVHGWSELTE